MLKKIGLIFISLSLLSTEYAQAFSLNSVTQNIPVATKHFDYALGTMNLLAAAYFGIGSYKHYRMHKRMSDRVNKRLSIPTGLHDEGRNLRKSKLHATLSTVSATFGLVTLYRAYQK